MTERPILFNADMTMALPDGHKTQTRRVIRKQEPAEFFEPDVAWIYSEDKGHSGPGWYATSQEYPEEGSIHFKCPLGKPGDRLWVRESFRWAKKGVPFEDSFDNMDHLV